MTAKLPLVLVGLSIPLTLVWIGVLAWIPAQWLLSTVESLLPLVLR